MATLALVPLWMNIPSVQSSRVADEPAFLSYRASPNEGGIPGGNSVRLVGPKTRLGWVRPGLGLTLFVVVCCSVCSVIRPDGESHVRVPDADSFTTGRLDAHPTRRGCRSECQDSGRRIPSSIWTLTSWQVWIPQSFLIWRHDCDALTQVQTLEPHDPAGFSTPPNAFTAR